jgi:hypothetical protein
MVRSSSACELRAPKRESDEISGVFREGHAFSRIVIKGSISAPRQARETHPFFGTLFCALDCHYVLRNPASGARIDKTP